MTTARRARWSLAALALPLALAGCAPLTARDLRQGSFSGHLAFEADEPIDEVVARLGDLAPGCLRREHGVVAQVPGEPPVAWAFTYGFTEYGDLVNTVAVELTPRPDGRTDVAIHYSPHLVERWKRYAVKTRKWILRQADDCAF